MELKETYAAWPKAMGVTPGHPAPPPQPLVRTVEPTDEDRVTHRHRLLAKVSVREARKPNWREERGARDLFHKLWGMAHDHDNYDKPLWGDLQGKLRGAGVWV